MNGISEEDLFTGIPNSEDREVQSAPLMPNFFETYSKLLVYAKNKM